MDHGELDRADLQHLGAERGHLEHFLVGNLVEPARLGDDARIGRIDAVHVGVDVAALGLDCGRERHRARVRAAAAERRDAAGRLVQALETGHDGNLPAGLKALDDSRAVDCRDARRGMGIRGHDRDLPALPGAGRKAHLVEGEGEKPRGHLLARGDDGVVFLRIEEARGFLDPADELVRLAGHRRDDHRHVVAGLDLAFDVPRHVADAFYRGDGRTAELHDEARHGCDLNEDEWLGELPLHFAAAKRRVYMTMRAVACQRGLEGLRRGVAAKGWRRRFWPWRRVCRRRSTRRRSPASNAWRRTGGTRRGRCGPCTSSTRCASPISATRPAGASGAMPRSRPLARRACGSSTSAAAAASSSEPLARLGAQVTGLDPAPSETSASRGCTPSAQVSPSTTRTETVEEVAARGESLRHRARHGGRGARGGRCGLRRRLQRGRSLPAAFWSWRRSTARMRAFALAIVGAEYVLGWLPKGTHQWEKFVTPAELSLAIEAGGLRVVEEQGRRLQSPHRRLVPRARRERELHGLAERDENPVIPARR